MSIKTNIRNGVATIEICRPEKKNAMTVAMYAAMAVGLRAADADANVRSILISGQPGIFCAGNDIEDFLQHPPTSPDAPLFDFMRALCEARKPVIAAVAGSAVGIGATMLLHCDYVVLAAGARLAMPFVSLGIVPEFASSLLLPRRVGQVKAAEIALLGLPFSAEDALAMQLVNAVVPAEHVLETARRAAERFNALPPSAVRETKKLLRRAEREEVLAAIALEGAMLGERLKTPEAKEAFMAFLEKRKPDLSSFK